MAMFLFVCAFQMGCQNGNQMATPYGQSYVEYAKSSRYNFIEYSFSKGDTAYYLENMNNYRTYLLWLRSTSDSIRIPSPKELPEGFVITKAVHLVPAKFSLDYSSSVEVISDQFRNTYIRIH